ncbi:MAG TPA: [Fe-Fe] hydrogenase large subunit C-terminal domain-containing protein [Acidobacteriota bacterium]|nr:[Fe-Fe] hydrogenase large subunit C-terminal domain-containing protein [Acidobacteriota bacterium]HQM64795.1 [Fe-Fe] hydrogenase large subunit C-terminal domain-containing protein [Acidobacteriota bacterium]
MSEAAAPHYIQTLRERCRVCYTCVRECPAKAIRILDGQAEVIPERCIGCGNCIRVCSQEAKQAASSIDTVTAMLADGVPVAAIIAPSYPAEFPDQDYRRVVGALKQLGFASVHEVAFGADLVSRALRQLLDKDPVRHYITTACPAVVAYIEKYHPDLLSYLTPIASPMIATARALRHSRPAPLRVVFIGPCIAKKGEATRNTLAGEVDAVMTFRELRRLLVHRGVECRDADPADFDPPLGGLGTLYPLSGGMFQSSAIQEDLLTVDYVAAEGRTNFVEAIKEFDSGALNARLLELLCCNGCTMGAGMSVKSPLFVRRTQLSRFARGRHEGMDWPAWEAEMARFADLDLGVDFCVDDQRHTAPSRDLLREIMTRIGKLAPEDELNCGACGYDTCVEHAEAIARGVAQSEMCLPHTIDQLRRAVSELAQSHQQLQDTQEALMHSEKLASMGQLAAGIAHEVNNPLGVVLMYSHLLHDECPSDSPLREDLRMITEQADRCKKIVAGLLDFARQNKVLHQPIDIRELVERNLQAIPTPAGVTVQVEHQLDDPVVELDRDQVSQVIINLVDNAYAAMPDGGRLTVRTRREHDDLVIEVEDTGIGIPKENIKKVFSPFFTTKQIGKGTGLGLAVSYGIVKMHRGNIAVESNADPAAGPTGTTFRVKLPRRGPQD